MSNVHVVSFLFLLYALSQINSEAVASGSLYQSFCNESLKLDDEICCEFVECDIHINIAFKYIFNKEMSREQLDKCYQSTFQYKKGNQLRLALCRSDGYTKVLPCFASELDTSAEALVSKTDALITSNKTEERAVYEKAMMSVMQCQQQVLEGKA